MTVSELKKGFVSIERVKKGGQKIVYKATRPDTSIVALKVINNATDPRVLQEIEVVQKLPIKNIPQILEHGVVHDELIDEDVLYIVEEFVEGVSMRDYLSAGKKMNLAYAHKLLKALLEIEVQLEENPFVKPNETPFQIMSRTMTMVPPSLVLAGDTQGMFAQFVNMLMAKNQSQRPDTAKDAMRYLSAITPTLKLEE